MKIPLHCTQKQTQHGLKTSVLDDTTKLGENRGKNSFDVNSSNISLDQPPKAKEIKTKTNKCNLIGLVGEPDPACHN